MILCQWVLCVTTVCILFVSASAQCADEVNFVCRSDKKCISAALVCDRKFDCDDHSDEETCSRYTVFCMNSTVSCISSEFFEVVTHQNGISAAMAHAYLRPSDVMAISIVLQVKMTRRAVLRLQTVQKMNSIVLTVGHAYRLSKSVMARITVWMARTKPLAVHRWYRLCLYRLKNVQALLVKTEIA